jgi:hypothetical protein
MNCLLASLPPGEYSSLDLCYEDNGRVYALAPLLHASQSAHSCGRLEKTLRIAKRSRGDCLKKTRKVKETEMVQSRWPSFLRSGSYLAAVYTLLLGVWRQDAFHVAGAARRLPSCSPAPSFLQPGRSPYFLASSCGPAVYLPPPAHMPRPAAACEPQTWRYCLVIATFRYDLRLPAPQIPQGYSRLSPSPLNHISRRDVDVL